MKLIKIFISIDIFDMTFIRNDEIKFYFLLYSSENKTKLRKLLFFA